MDMDIYVDGVGGWGRQRWLLREIKWRAPDARTRGLLFFSFFFLCGANGAMKEMKQRITPYYFLEIYIQAKV